MSELAVPPIQILGIGGSTRRDSRSLAALSAALRLAEAAGATTGLADVRELALPLYDADQPATADPPSLLQLRQDVRAADAYILCSPTYHGSISGAVKNVLDALNPLGSDDPPYLAGRPVALMALGGSTAMNVIDALAHASRALNGLPTTTPVTLSGALVELHAANGSDPVLLDRMRRMIDELIDLASRLRRPALLATRS